MQLRTTVTTHYDEHSSNTPRDNSAQRAYHFQRGGDFQVIDAERENAPEKQRSVYHLDSQLSISY